MLFRSLVANASPGDPKDPKKATTEMSKDCAAKCTTAAAAACADKAEVKKCDDAKTAEAKPSCAAKCTATAEAKKDCEAKTIASKK